MPSLATLSSLYPPPSLSLSLSLSFYLRHPVGLNTPRTTLDTFRLYTYTLSYIVIKLTYFARLRSNCSEICEIKWSTSGLVLEWGDVDELVNLLYLTLFPPFWAWGVNNPCLTTQRATGKFSLVFSVSHF